MKYQITNVSVVQTSKMVAVLYAIFGLFLVPIGLGVMMLAPDDMRFAGIFYLCAPLWYGLLGFVLTAIMLVIYNVLAKQIGGVEYTLEPVSAVPPVPAGGGTTPAAARQIAVEADQPAGPPPAIETGTAPWPPTTSVPDPEPSAKPEGDVPPAGTSGSGY